MECGQPICSVGRMVNRRSAQMGAKNAGGGGMARQLNKRAPVQFLGLLVSCLVASSGGKVHGIK